MERRVLLAIFLSFLVLYGYQALFVKPVPKPPATATTGAAGSPAPGTATPAASGSPSPTAAAPPAATAAGPTLAVAPPSGAPPVVGATDESDVRIETPHVVATFTNRGARLKSWRLKAYKDNRGEPLELVANDLATTEPLPFSLRVPDDATTGTLNGALYKVQGTVPTGVLSAPAQVTFEYQDSNGLHAVKQYTIDPATYTVALGATVTQGDHPVRPTIVWGPGLGDSDSQTGRYAVKPGGLFSAGGKVTRLAARNAAHIDTHESRACRLNRHVGQELGVIVDVGDVKVFDLLGAEHLHAGRHVLQHFGALLRRDRDLLDDRLLLCRLRFLRKRN